MNNYENNVAGSLTSARKLGMDYYYTGNRCANGRQSFRRTSDKTCVCRAMRKVTQRNTERCRTSPIKVCLMSLGFYNNIRK